MVNFSKVLKDLRKKEELSQKDLSIILSVSRSAVAQIENSNNNPSRDLMLKLLNWFDLNDDVRKQIEITANGIEARSELDKVAVDFSRDDENTNYDNTHVWDTYAKLLKNKQNILSLCILLKQNKYEFSVDERNKL
jgi:transcriptional regulator with XRE-family HTH domain